MVKRECNIVHYMSVSTQDQCYLHVEYNSNHEISSKYYIFIISSLLNSSFTHQRKVDILHYTNIADKLAIQTKIPELHVVHVDISRQTELELLVRQDSVIIIVNLVYPLLYFIKTKSVSDQLGCSSRLLTCHWVNNLRHQEDILPAWKVIRFCPCRSCQREPWQQNKNKFLNCEPFKIIAAPYSAWETSCKVTRQIKKVSFYY